MNHKPMITTGTAGPGVLYTKYSYSTLHRNQQHSVNSLQPATFQTKPKPLGARDYLNRVYEEVLVQRRKNIQQSQLNAIRAGNENVKFTDDEIKALSEMPEFQKFQKQYRPLATVRDFGITLMVLGTFGVSVAKMGLYAKEQLKKAIKKYLKGVIKANFYNRLADSVLKFISGAATTGSLYNIIKAAIQAYEGNKSKQEMHDMYITIINNLKDEMKKRNLPIDKIDSYTSTISETVDPIRRVGAGNTPPDKPGTSDGDKNKDKPINRIFPQRKRTHTPSSQPSTSSKRSRTEASGSVINWEPNHFLRRNRRRYYAYSMSSQSSFNPAPPGHRSSTHSPSFEPSTSSPSNTQTSFDAGNLEYLSDDAKRQYLLSELITRECEEKLRPPPHRIPNNDNFRVIPWRNILKALP